MILKTLRRLIVFLLVLLTSIGGNHMEPANEKQLFKDLGSAYNLSTTKMNKAISKAYTDASDRIDLEVVTPPPVVSPPPVITPPPISGAWPKDLTANPTGPKKTLPAHVGTFTTTQDGQVIDGLQAGVVNVNHNNVTIRNFKAEAIKKQPGKSGLITEDGIVDGQNRQENGIEWSSYTCRRVEITRTTDAFKAHGDVVIDSCWVHDLNFQTGSGTGAGGFSHNDGVQVSSGNNVVVKNSRFENTRGNAGVFVDPDQGTISNVTIENNFLTNVGNYMIYVKESASNPSTGLPSNVTIKGNIFGKRPDYLPADWGLMAAEIRANNLVWKDNVTSDGKMVVLNSWGKGETK